MRKSITPTQIRETNRQRIYQYIYQNGSVSQQDLTYHLRLSRPTVANNLAELKEEGFITEAGQIDTDLVGRKPSAYTINVQYRVSIGVELLSRRVKMIAVDLYGNKINREVFNLTFKNEDSYFQEVCNHILQFKENSHLKNEQILGVGFSIQGLTSPDGRKIIYGKILNCTGLDIEVFSKYLPFTCRFFHDADSAATSELWASPDLRNGFYLSLSRHLGAAIIHDRKIIAGIHGHNATVEHIQLKPDGDLCYCGKRGCLETLCSLRALHYDLDKLDEFFDEVRHENLDLKVIWLTYLKNLSRAINLLHLLYDQTFILGGDLAPYFDIHDIQYLYAEIQEQTPFPEAHDFLQISKMPKHNITIGAALPFIQNFLEKQN